MDSERKREIIDADPKRGTYRATYAYPSEPPSIAVPLALMEVADCEVTDLDPLYATASVDPDALDEVFRPNSGGISRDCSLTFSYHDYEITVKSYGRIVVRSPVA
jgi:hypothetical protein